MTDRPTRRGGELTTDGPFQGTPFHAESSAATKTPFWYAWGAYHLVDVFTEVTAEVRAFRRTAGMADMSPLNKTLVTGRDSRRLVDRVITRDAGDLPVGRMIYTPWCNRWGKVVGDGLVLRTAPDAFMFSAGPMDRWLTRHADAEGLDVDIRDVTAECGILALQGPRSRDILHSISPGTGWDELGFSRFRPGRMAGVDVRVLRTGFTGELGYEIWTPDAGAASVWRAVARAGAPLGLAPAGEHAVDVARVEAGLILIGADYNPAGAERRVAHYDVLDEGESSPFELGFDRFVDFGKRYFVGREALDAEARSGGPSRRLVGIEIDWRQALEEQVAGGLGPTISARVRKDALSLSIDGRRIGRVTSVTWAPTLAKLIGFGAVERDYSPRGTRMTVEWPLLDGYTDVRAEVVGLPFLKHHRAG